MSMRGWIRLMAITAVGVLSACAVGPDRQLDGNSVKIFYSPSTPVEELLVVRTPASFPASVPEDFNKNAYFTKYWNGGEFDRQFGNRIVANLSANGLRGQYVAAPYVAASSRSTGKGQFVLTLDLIKAHSSSAQYGSALMLYSYRATLYGPYRSDPVLTYHSDVAANDNVGPKDAFSAELINLLKSQNLLASKGPTVFAK